MNEIEKIMAAGYYSYGVNGRRGLTLMFVGNPGEGKTARIKGFGKAAGALVEAFEGSQNEPQDILGLPKLTDDTFRFVPPEKLTRLRDAGNRGGGGILFADEFTRQPSSVQAASLNLMLDGVTGAIDLGYNVARWAACNPAAQVGGIELDPANASRFIWVEWPALSASAFRDYLSTRNKRTGEGSMGEGFDPAAFEKNLAEKWDTNAGLADTYVGSFLVRNTSALREAPPVEARAWANPRTWDMATRALAAVDTHFGARAWDLKITLMAGAVGRGPADEFCTWLRTMDLPDPTDILDGKVAYDIAGDARADRVYVILDSTLSVIDSLVNGPDAGKDGKKETAWIGAWCRLLEAAAKKKAIRDIAAACVARAMSVKSSFYRNPEFIRQIMALRDFVSVIGAVSSAASKG